MLNYRYLKTVAHFAQCYDLTFTSKSIMHLHKNMQHFSNIPGINQNWIRMKRWHWLICYLTICSHVCYWVSVSVGFQVVVSVCILLVVRECVNFKINELKDANVTILATSQMYLIWCKWFVCMKKFTRATLRWEFVSKPWAKGKQSIILRRCGIVDYLIQS